MKTIWKFNIQIVDNQKLEMPLGAVILSAQFQKGNLCLWAIVEPGEKMREREIEIIGTGHSMRFFPRKYIDTVQQDDGNLVWHIFEIA